MLSSSKVSFWGPFWRVCPRKTSKFSQNNCLTNNFLHCEFQLSMSSRSKWLFFRPTFWGGALWSGA